MQLQSNLLNDVDLALCCSYLLGIWSFHSLNADDVVSDFCGTDQPLLGMFSDMEVTMKW